MHIEIEVGVGVGEGEGFNRLEGGWKKSIRVLEDAEEAISDFSSFSLTFGNCNGG